jgi:osmoprotectant transport system permease protein
VTGALTALALLAAAPALARAPVVVASKPFAESYLLAEMFAQRLEQRGIPVERRMGLGATEIAFGALRTGAVDVYPEYTGTGLLVILGEPPMSDPQAVFERVFVEFERRFGARWLPPLGFENTYAIAVRRETAARLQLRTLSDLARASPALRAGLTPDFIGRPDGLPGLERVYGLQPREVRALLPAVKYQALSSGAVDFIDGYRTDGFIARYDLVVLDDDRRFFPPYQAAALVGARLAREGEAIAALTELCGRLTEAKMRALNERVEVQKEDVAQVAALALSREDLSQEGLARGPDPATAPSIATYFWQRRGLLARLAARHLMLVAISLGAAIALGLSLGLALERLPRGSEAALRAVGLLQTIPGIALVAFMLPLFGIGLVPALVALVLYALYPIVRNTLTGVRSADPAAVAASIALGMSPWQVLRYVRLPLAAPVIMAGIRTAAVIDVGTATLAAFIGAGGLGDPIVSGLALSDPRMVLSGAVPAAMLALAVDGLLALAERAVRPRGLVGA